MKMESSPGPYFSTEMKRAKHRNENHKKSKKPLPLEDMRRPTLCRTRRSAPAPSRTQRRTADHSAGSGPTSAPGTDPLLYKYLPTYLYKVHTLNSMFRFYFLMPPPRACFLPSLGRCRSRRPHTEYGRMQHHWVPHRKCAVGIDCLSLELDIKPTASRCTLTWLVTDACKGTWHRPFGPE